MKEKSFYDLIKGNVVNGELPSGFSLPQDADPKSLKFAEGAMDGIGLYHTGRSELDNEQNKIMEKVIAYAADGSEETAMNALYMFLENNSALSVIDDVQRYIMDNRDKLDPRNIHKFAVACVFAPAKFETRETVKFGLSLLELFPEPGEEVKDIIRTLGLSDEFTLFALFNMRQWENGNDEIFSLARKVHGWGRVHAVEMLEPATDEIKKWLLREGVNNSVMAEYSALTVYNKAGVRELVDKELSDEDFRAVCDIIEGLVWCGIEDGAPVDGIGAVEDAEEMLTVFLNNQVMPRPLDFNILKTVFYISDLYNQNSPVTLSCGSILQRRDALGIIKEAVKRGEGVNIAKAFGIDFEDAFFEYMKKDFDKGSMQCGYLVHNDEYRDKVLDLFRERLPMDSMRTGPRDMMFGDAPCHSSLSMLIQELKPYPLCGCDFVELSLWSPVISTRNMALRVLSEWCAKENKSLKELSPELYGQVKLLSEKEMTDSVKNHIAECKFL